MKQDQESTSKLYKWKENGEYRQTSNKFIAQMALGRKITVEVSEWINNPIWTTYKGEE